MAVFAVDVENIKLTNPSLQTRGRQF